MSSPKHLWSGDWQRESQAAAAARAAGGANAPEPEPPPAPADPGAAPAPGRHRRPSGTARVPARPRRPAATRTRPRRRLRRPRVTASMAIAAAVVLVLAGAGWGVSALLSGGSTGRQSAPPAPLATAAAAPNPAAGPVAAPRQVSWLGMDIVSQPPGVAVVQTVALGTPADRAGINPGDVIVSINGRGITGATDIPDALRGLSAGTQVTLQLAYGSDVSQAELTLGKPPSISP